MQAIHDLLMSMTALLFAIAGMVVLLDLWHELEYRRSLARGIEVEAPSQSRWKVSLALALVAWLPLLVALCMVIFTSGRVAVHLGESDSAQVQDVTRVQAFAVQPSHVAAAQMRHR
jgi:hypothetical protein